MAVIMGIVARQLLLLHGFTHTAASWRPVVGALGKRYRALAPDLRGHGQASESRPVELAAVLADLDQLVDHSFTLAGYSLGGRLALHVALAHPERIDRLILIGASPGIAEERQRTERREADESRAEEMEQMTIEELAGRWAETPVLAGLPSVVAERAHADRLRNTPHGLARALRGLGTGALPSLWGRLGELSMPVALVVGERDVKFQRIGHEMVDLIPEAELIVVPGTGHAVHLEAPERVAQIIMGEAAPPTGQR